MDIGGVWVTAERNLQSSSETEDKSISFYSQNNVSLASLRLYQDISNEWKLGGALQVCHQYDMTLKMSMDIADYCRARARGGWRGRQLRANTSR